MPEAFTKSSVLPVSRQVAFGWHERPGAFERLNPPWEPVDIVEKTGGIQDGGFARVKIQLAPGIKIASEFRHQNFRKGEQFEDIQVRGPFAYWKHTHRFFDAPNGCSRIEDAIDFSLPAGFVGKLGLPLVRKKLERVFAYRHRITHDDLLIQSLFPAARPLRIAITGASGLVASSLIPFLQTAGHEVLRFTRKNAASSKETIFWDPANGKIEREKLEGVDAIVHLAGENIAAGRWTTRRKQQLWDSRVIATELLSSTIRGMNRPPKVLISASAIGFYGDRREETCSEAYEAGQGFLPDLSKAWEEAALKAASNTTRVVIPRIGIVLAAQGGALAKMLPAFRLGLGGPLGDGRQYMSWIELNDLVRSLYAFVVDTSLRGPVNCVAGSVTNKDFSRCLGQVLHRPVILPVPSKLLQAGLGEMASALLLSSTRVSSEILLGREGLIRCRSLEEALTLQLGRAEA